MKKLIAVILSGAIIFSLAGCGRKKNLLYEDMTLLTADIEKTSVPATDTSSMGQYVTNLGLDLLSASRKENPVISPLSAYLCLSMAAAGASGETADEFAALLGGSDEALGAFGADIREKLENGGENGAEFVLSNSAWTDSDANILESYLSRLASCYGAEMYSGDLATAKAKKAINSWVDDKTKGLIPQLLDRELSENTMLVLINTIYMNADWASPFKPESTKKDTFHGTKGDVEVDFMRQTASFGYVNENDTDCLVMPYKGHELYFAAIRSTAGLSPAELLSSLTGADLSRLLSAAFQSAGREVQLSIPKFTAECSLDMTETLPALGLETAFSPDLADFSLMGTGEDGMPLYISKVLQKVKVIVDEKGTEAAAATAAIMETGSGEPVLPVELCFDEPFIYVIFDTSYYSPIFLGILENPV